MSKFLSNVGVFLRGWLLWLGLFIISIFRC
jgi:hypothetical protein